MPEYDDNQPPELNLSAIEGNLFGALFSFHEKTMDLLRQSSLDDEKLSMATERMKTLLEDATAEMQRTQDLSILAPRLEAAYAEVQCLVDELSDPVRGSSNDEQSSAN